MTSSKSIEVMARAICCQSGCHIRRVNERASTAAIYDTPWSCLWESKIPEAQAALTAYESHLQASNQPKMMAADIGCREQTCQSGFGDPPMDCGWPECGCGLYLIDQPPVILREQPINWRPSDLPRTKWSEL